MNRRDRASVMPKQFCFYNLFYSFLCYAQEHFRIPLWYQIGRQRIAKGPRLLESREEKPFGALYGTGMNNEKEMPEKLWEWCALQQVAGKNALAGSGS